MKSALTTELPSRFSGGINNSINGYMYVYVRRVTIVLLVFHPNCCGLFFLYGFGFGLSFLSVSGLSSVAYICMYADQVRTFFNFCDPLQGRGPR